MLFLTFILYRVIFIQLVRLVLVVHHCCYYCRIVVHFVFSFHYSLLQLQRLCWNHSSDLKKFVNVFWPFRNTTINPKRGTYARGELYKEKCFISRKLSRRQNIYDFDNSGRHSRLLTGMHPEHCFKSHWKQLRVEKEKTKRLEKREFIKTGDERRRTQIGGRRCPQDARCCHQLGMEQALGSF